MRVYVYIPMNDDRPFGLWMGDGCGAVTAHSYHTLRLEVQRHMSTVIEEADGKVIGVRKGK